MYTLMDRMLWLTLAILLWLPGAGEAFLGWRSIKTDGYTVFYPKGAEDDAREALNALEYYRDEVTGLTGDRPRRFAVVIEDVGTLANGLANPVYGYMRLFPYPFTGQQADENWLSNVARHELIHMHHFNNVGGLPGLMRTTLGNLFLPNLLSPGWLYEGIAVYGESQGRRFSGRLNNGYYDTYVRAALSEDRFPCIVTATYSPWRYPYGDGIYLFGSTFFRYLADTYGEPSFAEFFTRNGRSARALLSPVLPYVGLDRSARSIYGKSFPALWREWRNHLQDHSRPYRVDGDRLTHRGDYIDNLHVYQEELYYTRSYAVKTGARTAFSYHQIVRLRDDAEEMLVTTTAPIRGFAVDGDRLWYGVQELAGGYGNTFNQAFGYQTALRLRELSSSRDRRVLQTEMRAFTVLQDGAVLYAQDRKDGFGARIYALDPVTGTSQLRFTAEYIIDRLLAQDGRVFVSARRDWENWSLYEMDPADGRLQPLVHTPYVEQLSSVANGRVFFTANYRGEYNLYSVTLADGAVTRHQGEGFVRGAAQSGDGQRLLIAGLHAGGFDVYADQPRWVPHEVPRVTREAPIPQVLPERAIRYGSYQDNLRTLRPVIHLPMFYADGDSTAVGLYAQGGDAIGHFEYWGEASYHVDRSRDRHWLHTDMQLSIHLLAPWRTSLRHTHRRDDHELALRVDYPLVRRLQPGVSQLSAAMEIKRFQDFDRLLLTPQLNLGWRYPGWVGRLHVRAPWERQRYGSSLDRTGFDGTALVYRHLRHNHLRLALRGIYDPDHPNEAMPVIRGYSDPLEGNRGGAGTIELSLPPVRIGRGLWNPNLFLEDLHASLFVVGATADQGRFQAAAGVELGMDGGMLFFLPVHGGVTLAYNRDRAWSADFFVRTETVW